MTLCDVGEAPKPRTFSRLPLSARRIDRALGLGGRSAASGCVLPLPDLETAMKQLVFSVLLALAMMASAQPGAALSGLIQSEEPLADNTRVAIHVVDSDNVWGLEVASVVPVGGTFRITPGAVPEEQLRPFRSGGVILPGIQNEYRVAPDDVKVAVARFNMYVDQNGNEVFDRVVDRWYVGVPRLENPIGFFTLLYVDKAATIAGSGSELSLQPGWNVFTVRFPDEEATYAVQSSVDDIVLDVVLQ